MKRFPLFFAAIALIAWLGCDKAKNPAAPEKAAIEQDETELADAAAKASRAVIKVPDDYATIQAAVDAANPGTKIVVKASGSPYNEIVNINNTGIHLTTKGPVTLNGKFLVYANEVSIEGFIINIPSSNDAGIVATNVSGVRIRKNRITGGGANGSILGMGIALYQSTGCSVKDNVVTAVNPIGIQLFEANGNLIQGNHCSENLFGIVIASGASNEVSGNNSSSNLRFGISLSQSSAGNVIKKNLCNRNGLVGVQLHESTNNQIGPGNTANFNGNYGITLYSDTSNNSVKNNDAHCNNNDDILDFGTGNTLINNSTGPLPECQ
jgi:parallel beta-helix repeat protein